MLNKNMLFICLLAASITPCIGQTVQVDYVVQFNTNNVVSKRVTDYTLILDGPQSLYFNPKLDPNDFVYGNIGVTKETEDRIVVQVNESTSTQIPKDRYYKNYTINSLVFNEYLQNEPVVVTEPISMWNWILDPMVDSVILGQKCGRATTEFRGRTYEAYFSTALAPYGGPWKFDGLPGLILAVRSLDNYFVILPTKVSLNSPQQVVNNPYQGNNDILSWEEYVAALEKKLRKVARKLRSLGGGGRIEITDRIEDVGIGPIEY